MNKSILKKDERWNLWQIKSIEYFEKLASKINLNPVISEDIIKRFEVVRKLIIHSYFEYEFLDVALDRTLVNFEMVLRNRYFEVTNKDSKNIRFQKLIEWGNNQALFEDDEEIIQKARELRNRLTAHPKKFHLLGHLSISMILRTVDIINDLYEDTDLRKKRKQEENTFNELLNNFCENGAILELTDSKLIIFKAYLLYYNNKIRSKKYYILFYPIFDPVEKESRINIPEPIVKEFVSWKFDNNVLVFSTCQDQNNFIIKKIIKTDNKKKYSQWKQSFVLSTFPLQYYIEIKIGELRSQFKDTT